jgi:hypothetical protein
LTAGLALEPDRLLNPLELRSLLVSELKLSDKYASIVVRYLNEKNEEALRSEYINSALEYLINKANQ